MLLAPLAINLGHPSLFVLLLVLGAPIRNWAACSQEAAGSAVRPAFTIGCLKPLCKRPFMPAMSIATPPMEINPISPFIVGKLNVVAPLKLCALFQFAALLNRLGSILLVKIQPVLKPSVIFAFLSFELAKRRSFLPQIRNIDKVIIGLLIKYPITVQNSGA